MDVRAALPERGVIEDLLVQRNIRLDPFDDHFSECIAHARDRRVPRIP